MTIAERILFVIENKGMNMSKAAKALNVTPAYISKLKKQPDSVPSDRFIIDFCHKFEVNRSWLCTGDGDMNAPLSREQEIAEITASIIKENNPIRIELDKIVHKLTDEQLENVYKIAKKLVDAVEKEKDIPD